jgi:beta-galactosidase
LEGAEELARYVHPFHGRFPAVTSHAYGRGRLTYVGTVLDRRGAGRLLRWAAGQAGIDAPWPDLPDSVRVDGGVNGRGERIWLLTNWSWEPARVRDVELGPLEVKLVRE